MLDQFVVSDQPTSCGVVFLWIIATTATPGSAEFRADPKKYGAPRPGTMDEDHGVESQRYGKTLKRIELIHYKDILEAK